VPDHVATDAEKAMAANAQSREQQGAESDDAQRKAEERGRTADPPPRADLTGPGCDPAESKRWTRRGSEMETAAEIRQRWRYLRKLLIEQVGRFESGALKLRVDDVNVSAGAVILLKRHIQDFDELIARSEARDR
jgi:hypothetical protein